MAVAAAVVQSAFGGSFPVSCWTFLSIGGDGGSGVVFVGTSRALSRCQRLITDAIVTEDAKM